MCMYIIYITKKYYKQMRKFVKQTLCFLLFFFVTHTVQHIHTGFLFIITQIYKYIYINSGN